MKQDTESLLRQMDDELNILVLIQGTLADGSAHYAYASIPPSRYDAFLQAQAKGNYDLAEYGEILVHGEGKTPPANVQRRMEEEYGANHRLEDEFEAWLRQPKPKF